MNEEHITLQRWIVKSLYSKSFDKREVQRHEIFCRSVIKRPIKAQSGGTGKGKNKRVSESRPTVWSPLLQRQTGRVHFMAAKWVPFDKRDDNYDLSLSTSFSLRIMLENRANSPATIRWKLLSATETSTRDETRRDRAACILAREWNRGRNKKEEGVGNRGKEAEMAGRDERSVRLNIG